MAKTYIPAKPCPQGHRLRYANRKCVECAKVKGRIYAKQWRENNPEKVAQHKQIYKYPEKQKARSAAWYQANKERARLFSKQWKATHPDLWRSYLKKYKVAKRTQIPTWLTADDYDRIAAMYTEAARLTRETGVVHHVDHYVPLQGKTVSGLHVPDNLQILTASENRKKRNRWMQ